MKFKSYHKVYTIEDIRVKNCKEVWIPKNSIVNIVRIDFNLYLIEYKDKYRWLSSAQLRLVAEAPEYFSEI